jgi:hypothetical protein
MHLLGAQTARPTTHPPPPARPPSRPQGLAPESAGGGGRSSSPAAQQLGAKKPAPPPRLTFKLYFPRPPHTGLDYKAAKNKEGYNFVVSAPLRRRPLPLRAAAPIQPGPCRAAGCAPGLRTRSGAAPQPACRRPAGSGAGPRRADAPEGAAPVGLQDRDPRRLRQPQRRAPRRQQPRAARAHHRRLAGERAAAEPRRVAAPWVRPRGCSEPRGCSPGAPATGLARLLPFSWARSSRRSSSPAELHAPDP